MNPDTGKMDEAVMAPDKKGKKHLVYAEGSRKGQRVPPTVPVFTQNELITIKGWLFKLKYMDGKDLLLTSFGPVERKARKEMSRNQRRNRRKKLAKLTK